MPGGSMHLVGYTGMGDIEDAESCRLYSQGEINILLVCEVTFIKKPYAL
jgi:hypothetical protein